MRAAALVLLCAALGCGETTAGPDPAGAGGRAPDAGLGGAGGGAGLPGAGGGGTAGPRCARAADCDDGIACTEDLCGIDGACVRLPNNRACGPGRTCQPGLGCSAASSCREDRDCDDGVHCNGAETCSPELACVAGAPPACDDGDACTDDRCDEATRLCEHPRRPECSGMTVDGTFDITPMVSFQCSAVGVPLIDVQASMVALSVSGGMLTVTGLGPSLTGPAPGGTSFAVSGMVAGTCTEVYTLTGSFQDADHFTASFSIALQGLDCGLAECTPPAPYGAMIAGTRR